VIALGIGANTARLASAQPQLRRHERDHFSATEPHGCQPARGGARNSWVKISFPSLAIR
jgi:hypothetical protein